MSLIYSLIILLILLTVVCLLFSTLTYSLRDFSRSRLEQYLNLAGRKQYYESTTDHAQDMAFASAVIRLFANLAILLIFQRLFQQTQPLWVQYLLSLACAGAITLVFSVALPHALAEYAAERMIVMTVRPLHLLRLIFVPVIKISHVIESLVKHASGSSIEAEHEELENEIIAAVEEGEKEGVVDEEEREMIESVIEFHDTQVGHVMTARPEIVALDVSATLEQVKQTVEESSHSRIPVYEGSLDHVVGVLYARDLLKFVGQAPQEFKMKSVMRPAYFVPETKLLGDLLADFRLQKVHMAIVLDEYGGTAGLATIEDLLEEVVGDISDEYESAEPAMFRRLDEDTVEVDARIYIDEINNLTGLNLPEDSGYSTLGGFIVTTLGHIPPIDASFTYHNAAFTILDAEPQKVNRVKIVLKPQKDTDTKQDRQSAA